MVDVQIEKRIVLSTGQAAAWAVVTDFASWFCDGADVDEIATGRRVEFSWAGRTRAAVFEDVDAPRYLAFRWLPFARDESGEAIPKPQARVEISLSPVDDGVEIVVVERRLDEALAGVTA